MDAPDIGPVQLLAIGFGEGTEFRGEIIDELSRLEETGQIRVLDLAFMHRDPVSGTLIRAGYEGGDDDAGERVSALLGEPGAEEDGDEAGSGRAFRLAADDMREMAESMAPGTSVGVVIFEHVWARELKGAIERTGGRTFMEGFLTPRAVSALGG